MKSKSNRHSLPTPQPTVPAPSTDRWLDIVDLMEEFHISRRTLHRWCQSGLVFSKVLGKIYFQQTEIDRFMKANELNGSG